MKINHPKVSQAVTSLAFSNPFFASVALQLSYVEDLKCKTYWTDGKSIGYNPNFADSLTLEENIGVIAHEVMHVVLLHHARMNLRDVETWNKAADYVINNSLVKSGFKLPKGALIDNKYNNMNAEDVYRLLEQDKQSKKDKKKENNKDNNKNELDNGFGEVRECKDCKPEEIEEKAIIMGKMAENAAKLCGNLPVGMDRLLAEARIAKTDWREVLSRFLDEVSAKDYSFNKPNKRFMGRGFILPSLYSKTIGKVIIAVDTSGSVNEGELNRLIGEVTKILDFINESKDAAEIEILYFDHAVQGHETYTGNEVLKPKGGGGTCFKSFINYIEENDMAPNLVICLTDGASFSFPNQPDYPVLWALTMSQYENRIPFGEKMILQD
jgi:predicted metal-dependent peptidase